MDGLGFSFDAVPFKSQQDQFQSLEYGGCTKNTKSEGREAERS